jgi:hypothetical protein
MSDIAETKDSAFAEFSMTIHKANVDKNGVMRWRSVNSDIGEDFYGERMSKELFQDFIQHINNEDDIPEPFKSAICEEDWCGGMPYISIAHYKSGAGRVNVPGEPQKIYLDGDALKSTGILYDTPLGRAVFKSLQKDLVEKRDDKARISIGFLDLEHSHGDKFTFTRKALTDKCPLCKKGVGDKIYKKGHLVHLALTRVPANPRTDVEVEKSMTTKLEDAKSIIEDEEVLKGLELKSQTDEALVIKMDEEHENEMDGKKKKPVKEEAEEKSVLENTVFPTPEAAVAAIEAVVAPAPEPTAIEKSFLSLKSKIEAIKSQGLTGSDALQQVQAEFDQMGEVIKSELTPPPSPEEIQKQTLESTLRSLLSEMLPQMLAQTVAPMQSEFKTEVESLKSELRAKSLATTATPVKEKVETVQRSLTAAQVQKAVIEQIAQKSISQFDQIARQSVGLQ